MKRTSESADTLTIVREAREKIIKGNEGEKALVSSILITHSPEADAELIANHGFLFPVPRDEMITAYTHFFTERVKDAKGRCNGLPPDMKPEYIYLRMLEDEDYLRNDYLLFVSEERFLPRPDSSVAALTTRESGGFQLIVGKMVSPADDLIEFARAVERFTSYLKGTTPGNSGTVFIRIEASQVLG